MNGAHVNHQVSSRIGMGILTLTVVVTAAAFGVSVVYGAWMQGTWRNIARAPALPIETATAASATSPNTAVVVLAYADGDHGVVGLRAAPDSLRVAPIPRTTKLAGSKRTLSQQVQADGELAAAQFLTELGTVPIQHLVVVDMPCLVRLADVLGGLPVAGSELKNSPEILAYLTEPGQRDARELQVLNSLTQQAFSTRYLASPSTVKRMLGVVEGCLTVDEQFTPDRLNNVFWAINWADKNHVVVPVPPGELTDEQVASFRLVWDRKAKP